MNQSEDQLRERLFATYRMPRGRAQVAEVEEIIRHVDAMGLEDLRYMGRMVATSAYQYGAEPAKAFVTFSWCLAAYDRGEGDRQFDHNLYWYFKWMVSSLTKFPEVPLARTYAVLDDMERRYRLAGHTMNPVHQHRELVARHVGDQAEAAEQYRLWGAAPRGEMSDCVGCEPTSKVEHLTWLGRHEEAVALALPVVNGDLTCVEQPQAILTDLLVPYLVTGRLDEAADAHRRAYRAVQGDRGELSAVADHVAFCGLTGNHARALELVERHVGWLDEPPTPHADMWFSASAASALRQVSQAGHGDAVIRRQTGEVSVAELRDELVARALDLAVRFDQRNASTEQGDRVKALIDADPIVEHLPLSGPVRRATRRAVEQPAPVAYPADPAELADLAENALRLTNVPVAAAIWDRFDQVCPEPEGELLGRRLVARGAWQSTGDVTVAEATWTRATEVFADAGAEARRQITLSRIALVMCMTGRADEGLAQLADCVDRLAEMGDPKSQARVELRRASALTGLRRHEEALASVERAEQLAAEVNDTLLLAETAKEHAEVLAGLPDQGDGPLRQAERAIELHRSIGPSNALCQTLMLGANLRAGAGDLAGAETLLAEATSATIPGLRGQVSHLRGRIAMDMDRVEDAYESLTDAVAGLTESGYLVPAAYANVDLATACLRTDRPAELADAAEEALPLLARIGDTTELARARFVLARGYSVLGQPEQALSLLDQVIEHCASEGNHAGTGQMRKLAAEILNGLDRDAEAAERFAAASSAYGEVELRLDELMTRRRAALAWLWAGEHDQATDALATADDLATRLVDDEPGVQWERVMLGYDGARVLANSRRFEPARIRIAPVADRFRAMGADVEAAMSDALHGRVLVELSRPDEAEKVLVAALAAMPPEATGPRDQIEAMLASIRG